MTGRLSGWQVEDLAAASSKATSIDVDDTLILLNRKATPDGTVLLGWAYADWLHSWTEVVPT